MSETLPSNSAAKVDSARVKPTSSKPTASTSSSSPVISAKLKSAKLKKIKWSRRKKALLLGLFALILLIVIPAIITGVKVMSLKASAPIAESHARAAADALKNQDLLTAKAELDALSGTVAGMHATYQSMSYLLFSPFRWHYQDGQHAFNAAIAGVESAQLAVGAIEPYADVIGFAGAGSFTGGTVENRITAILETVGKVTPVFDELTTKMAYISAEVEAIDPDRYPFNYQGKPISELINNFKSSLKNAEATLTHIRPLVESLPSVAGAGEPKTYLVLFQNDGEIRATGGFMTAFAIVKVENGMVIPEKSDDIYELDDKFTLNLEPPPTYKDLLLVKRWNLRDLNVSPDYRESMELFQKYYDEIPGETPVDGIIAIDTQALSRFVQVLGPLEVPGYGTFSAENDPRCDCPEIIYELEDIATRPTPYFRSDRKAILGPMMGAMLAKAFAAESDIWPPLFSEFWNLIQEKHILFYFNDPEHQKAAELNNFAGRMLPFEGDYLHINDTNLGGAKSYMFVEQEVEQAITFADGKVTKTVDITYKNPRPGDNCNLEAGQLCLNGRMPLWVRLYVPSGSTLTTSTGFDEGTVHTSTQFDKTVFEGVLVLDPESSKKVSLTYEIPYAPSGEYQLYLQKQPGTRDPSHAITFDGMREDIRLVRDQIVKFPIH